MEREWAVANHGTQQNHLNSGIPVGNEGVASGHAGSNSEMASSDPIIDRNLNAVLASTTAILTRAETMGQLFTRAVEERESMLREIKRARQEVEGLAYRFRQLQSTVGISQCTEPECSGANSEIMKNARANLEHALQTSRMAESCVAAVEARAATLLSELLSRSPGKSEETKTIAAQAPNKSEGNSAGDEYSAVTNRQQSGMETKTVFSTEEQVTTSTISRETEPAANAAKSDQDNEASRPEQTQIDMGPAHFQVKLNPVPTFGKMQELEREIGEIPTIESIRIAGWQGQNVTLELTTRMPRNELVERLAKLSAGAQVVRTEETEIELALAEAIATTNRGEQVHG